MRRVKRLVYRVQDSGSEIQFRRRIRAKDIIGNLATQILTLSSYNELKGLKAKADIPISHLRTSAVDTVVSLN